MSEIKQNSAVDPIRVMVVDDSAVVRGMISRILEDDDAISITVSVSNGEIAINNLGRHDIDVIILDIEMPVMDGMTALPKLLEIDPSVKIIMASTLTLRNANISLRALEAGAADYLPKPISPREITSGGDFRRELVEKTKALGMARRQGQVPEERRGLSKGIKRKTIAAVRKAAPRIGPEAGSIILRNPGTDKVDILAVGSSTGGPKALFAFLSALKKNLNIPILITQHMPPTFTAILAEHISNTAGWPCSEGKDGDVIKAGNIYLAPGNYHMTVTNKGPQRVISLNQKEPVNFCRPAVDPMFNSIAKVFGSHVLGVILTGMGSDGANGGKEITNAGGTVIAQDEKTSVVWGMPGAAAGAEICSAVLPLDELAAYVMKHSIG